SPPPPSPPTSPTAVTFSLATNSLASSQTTNGLAANSPIVIATQAGGASGDSFTYGLGGNAAGSFTLTTSNNTATLSTSASGVAGARNGNVYALTVTATDTTNGPSSPPPPVDVVVGSGGNDTINLAALVASGSTATPTFVFGLSGNDTINGTGVTSKLWITGGT